MASGSDRLVKVIGLVLLVGGAGIAYWGYQMSGSLTAELTRTLSGALPDEIMYRYIGGAIGCVVGLFLLTRR